MSGGVNNAENIKIPIRKNFLFFFKKSSLKIPNFVRKIIQVEEIAVKRVCFEKAKNFYEIILEEKQEGAKFFQAKGRYKRNKKLRRDLNVLKGKLHFLSDN